MTKVFFREPDSPLYKCQGKFYTSEEIKALRVLMPGAKFIRVEWADTIKKNDYGKN